LFIYLWQMCCFITFSKYKKILGRNLFLCKKIIIRNFWNVTSENQEDFNEMPVPSQVSEWLYICLVGINFCLFLLFSKFDFRTFHTVWYFFIIILCNIFVIITWKESNLLIYVYLHIFFIHFQIRNWVCVFEMVI
jgi:hypothetical protein